VGERPRHGGGRVGHMGELFGKFGPRRGLDRQGKPRDHVTKKIDLRLVERVRRSEEQVRDTTQRIHALLFVAACHGGFEVSD
jgi:hypothetical protein